MKRTKKTSSKYSDYSKATQTFMGAVETHLINKFGSIEAQWDGLLLMLATNYELFWQCKNNINEQGLTVSNRFGGIDKNPLLKVQIDAQIQIIKLVAEFGISPKSIKNLNVGNNDESEFINSLMS
ncbi:P27 family phage terminase small subunit [Prevotella koreensis]